MKFKTPVFLVLTAMIMLLTGCEIVADIFRAGMGVGIFLVLVVIAFVIYLIIKLRKRS